MSVNSSAPRVELPTDKELVLKVIPMPADCNANGDIFGGWVMAHVDMAGAVIPARYTQGRMATVAERPAECGVQLLAPCCEGTARVRIVGEIVGFAQERVEGVHPPDFIRGEQPEREAEGTA